MEGQRVASPGDIRPAAEVSQQLRGARLPHERQILQSPHFETAAKPAALADLARDQQTPCPRHEAGKFDESLIRRVAPRREDINCPDRRVWVKYPKLAPAFERLDRQLQRLSQRNRLRRGFPHDAICAASYKR